MAILTEEVGEVARIMSRKYGEQSFKKSDQGDLADELADVFFVIICLANQTGINLTEAFKIKNNHQYAGKILTIPFERFVLDPWPYMGKIEKLVDSKVTKRTKRIIKKQKVPRKKISEGIPLAIYKRCGWEPPVKGLTEGEELNKRREFAIDQGASDQALQLLDKMSSDYEQSYGIWF